MAELTDASGFATTSPSDHRAWIWVASILSLVYSFFCLAARVTGKWGLLWWDDLILSIGYFVATIHWGILFRAISDGVGVASIALSSAELSDAAKLYFASRIPLFLAHCLAKLSILVFTRRIFAGDIYKENLIFGLGYAITIIYGLLAILLSSAGCHPSETLTASVNAVCNANTARWAVITALDGVTELIILAMPIWFISKNQLRASKKRIVIFVYSFRLIIIAFTIATTASYFNFLKYGRNDIDVSPVVAWQEVLLGFSLISASFPCLRSFLWAFMSRGLMTMYGNTTTLSSGTHSQSQLRSQHRSTSNMQLRSLHTKRSANDTSTTNTSPDGGNGGENNNFRLRPERGLNYSVQVRGNNDGRGTAPSSKKSHSYLRPSSHHHHSQNREEGKRSDDSDRMIIHHQTSITIETS